MIDPQSKLPFRNARRCSSVALCFAIVLLLSMVLFGCDEEDSSSSSSSSSSTVSSSIEMPNVSGKKADVAQKALKDSGFTDVTFKSDSGKGVWDYSNWTVIAQDPQEGTACSTATSITITVKQTDEIAEADIAAVVGMSVADANAALVEKGYTLKYVHAVTGMDYTSEVFADGLPWIVTDCAALDEDTKTVTLKVDNQENMDRINAQKATEDALSAKLGSDYAWQAVESYGKAQYPQGFDLNWWTGKLAQTAEDENTWFLKATCNIKTEYGKKVPVTCEAKVTGTNENPQVTEFIIS